MGADPQGYLQYKYDRQQKEFLAILVLKYPFMVYSGSEKIGLADAPHVTALCSSQYQAEALIKAMWPTTGYWKDGRERDAPPTPHPEP
jgi:hypothetical protein